MGPSIQSHDEMILHFPTLHLYTEKFQKYLKYQISQNILSVIFKVMTKLLLQTCCFMYWDLICPLFIINSPGEYMFKSMNSIYREVAS